MKQDHSNHLLLGTIVGLLIISAGLLNYKEKIKADSAPQVMVRNPLDDLSIEKAYGSLQHLMASRSVSTIVQMLQGMSVNRTLSIAQMILASKNTALTREDKAVVILGLIHNISNNIKVEYQLLDMLKQFRDTKKDKPLLVSTVHSQYSTSIPVILAWMKERGLDEVSIMNAFTYTIMHNDVAGFTKLVGHAVPITAAQATTLLTKTVTQKKMVEFVPLLIDLGADINFASQGKTMLMQAVLQNNIDMVTALLKAGATKNIDTIVDPKVGSALQLAIEKNYTNIDLLLRQYGARE